MKQAGMKEEVVLSLRNAVHRYDVNTEVILPDLAVKKGEHRLILGQSGTGKSTLLHILAGILKPTEGMLEISGTDLYAMKEADRDEFRGRHIGLIFQQMHLIDSISVMENLLLAAMMAGMEQDKDRAEKLCRHLDIWEKRHSLPETLSQGQKQRVSIARAVMNRPSLILADEPTSSLDDVRTEQVIAMLTEQAAEAGATLVISTHDRRLMNHFEHRTLLGGKPGQDSKPGQDGKEVHP
jgi:putative ABC transport system ATP-binding protein